MLAYGAWGILPAYWKIFQDVSAGEVLAHRMVWAMPFTVLLLAARGRMGDYLALLRQPRRLLIFAGTATILAGNWGIYIYGVNSDRIVETSLGYFINPLVTVALGFVFLRERFGRNQIIALALATFGVGWMVWQVGQWPWIALTLAFSFGFYGLVRKVVPVRPLVGLAAETTVLAPLAAAFLLFQWQSGSGQFNLESWRALAFIGAGVVTSLPLLWFAQAARHLRLSTLGMFQYMAPTLQLLMGVFLYNEPFKAPQAVAFGCIAVALAIFSLDAFSRHRRENSAA